MIKPCGTTVLIEVEPVEETSKGGIVIASKSELKREFGGRDIGRIIAFGDYCYKDFKTTPEGWGCKVGDLVEFNRYDGKSLRKKKYKNFRLINDNDILAVYPESDEGEEDE